MIKLDTQNLHFDLFDKLNNYLYVRVVLGICSIILFSYTIYNFVVGHYLDGIFCLGTGIFVLTDYIIIQIKGRIFNNLIISILCFTILCIKLIFMSEYDLNRMWILLLPLIIFYTQSIKRSTIYVTLCMVALLSHHIYRVLIGDVFIRLNVEQIIIFILLSFMTYIYAESARKKNVKIKDQLIHDPLTGLPNRTLLLEKLNDGKYRTIALINMDNFKNINNLYGTKVGDQLLILLGERLSQYISTKFKYKLYRLHADEFAITSDSKKGDVVDINFHKKLLIKMRDVIIIDKIEIYPSLTIGLHLGNYNIIEDADMALKRAKELKKNIVVYDDSNDLLSKYKENHDITVKLKKCLNSDNILPAFQPIYSLNDGEIYKYESLVRICCDGVIHKPVEFLDISKQIKLYHLITKNMLLKSIEKFKGTNLNFSINLDYDDFSSELTTSFIINRIIEFDIGNQITFEILESSKIIDMKKITHFINIVKHLGCKIAIDDFGAGYSNFNYLIELKADYIKIDSSLIKNIDTDDYSKALTKSIVSFAKELNIKTIAEYVNRIEVYNYVKSIGVDYVQGYLLGKPDFEVQEIVFNR